jgi:Cof subfamily protein (haloacid dehalogenase superfamily)
MIKVIATDLDGTLFYPKKRMRMVSHGNRKFMNNYLDRGGRIVLVSGRNRYFGHKVMKATGRNLDLIGCNSSFIEIDGRIVKETFFDKQEIISVINDIQKIYKPKGFFLMTKDKNMVLNRKDMTMELFIGYRLYEFYQGVYREPFIQSDEVFAQELEKGQVYKVMFMFGISKKSILRAKEVNKELRNKYPNIESCWIGEFIELSPKGCNKAEGIKFYLDYLKINYDNVMVVGDSGNDISMFQAFENSYCMKKAPDTVSKYANHLINKFSDLQDYVDRDDDIKEK